MLRAKYIIISIGFVAATLAVSAFVRAQVSQPKMPFKTDMTPTSRGNVAVFASAKIGKERIRSYFSTIPEYQASHNQCELALGETLAKMGFGQREPEFSQKQKEEARKLMTVFGRYRDMSTMANGTAVKAARIVDPDAKAVVLCMAEVDTKKRYKRADTIRSCADIRCKLVSMRSSKRFATYSIRRCVKAPDDTNINIDAIRRVCSEAGRGIGGKMIDL